MRFCIRSGRENLERVRYVERAGIFSRRPSARTKPFNVEFGKGEGYMVQVSASHWSVTCHIQHDCTFVTQSFSCFTSPPSALKVLQYIPRQFLLCTQLQSQDLLLLGGIKHHHIWRTRLCTWLPNRKCICRTWLVRRDGRWRKRVCDI